MLSQLLLIDNIALASTSLLCEKAVNNVGAEVDADSNAEKILLGQSPFLKGCIQEQGKRMVCGRKSRRKFRWRKVFISVSRLYANQEQG